MFSAFKDHTRLAIINSAHRVSFKKHMQSGIIFYSILFAAAATVQLIDTPPVDADQPDRPNMIFIMADDK